MFDIFKDYSEAELKTINYNFAFLEILKKDNDYSLDRGARNNRVWSYVHTDGTNQKIIEEIYVYTWKSEVDGKERMVDSVSKKVRFYKADGSIGFERAIKERSDKFYLQRINRDIRHNRIDYLKSEAENIEYMLPYMTATKKVHYTGVIASIQFILKHYNVERLKYIEDGGYDFEQLLINETDTDILAHLNKTTIFPGQDVKWPNGQTIKQSIIYQLTGEIA